VRGATLWVVDPEVRWAIRPTEAADAPFLVSMLVEADAAADFLFLLPNLIVADKGITGLPKNAITESLDLAGLD